MDFGSTEASAARQQAVANIRARVCEHVASWLTDPECVQVALSASTREPDELAGRRRGLPVQAERGEDGGAQDHPSRVGACCPAAHRDHTRRVERVVWSMARSPTKTSLLEKVVEEKFVQAVATRSWLRGVGRTLRCTIGEQAQGSIWARAWTKSCCYLAMHNETHEECIATCLGNVVRADSRRLEELRVAIDDEGLETMLLGQMLVALADSVT